MAESHSRKLDCCAEVSSCYCSLHHDVTLEIAVRSISQISLFFLERLVLVLASSLKRHKFYLFVMKRFNKIYPQSALQTEAMKSPSQPLSN